MRVKRTKQNIIHAFIELTKEKNISAITVQEIAQKAMINRATFYAHYRDKQDLYQHIFNQVIGLFAPLRNPRLFLNRQIMFSDLEKTITAVLKDCNQNRDLILFIIDDTPAYKLQEQLRPVLAANIAPILDKVGINRNSAIPADLVITYIIAMFTSVIAWWLHNGAAGRISEHQLAHTLVQLALEGHMKVLGFEPKF
ncbi:TetR/AcrR family transcriptional regulator [Limosilactobacillus sp.]|uniref:TetR/AcrR family transcriptional regulator n=1 Tax=Limosilactobacillus sp. TaxID=2773925 RepID=UPI003F09C13F